MAQVAGQSAGDPRMELLRDPLKSLIVDATSYAAAQFAQRHGSTLSEALPNFENNLKLARSRAILGQYRRKQMPVIEEDDLQDLRKVLSEEGIHDICDVCTITPTKARPSQCQIYVDKSVNGTARFGLEGTMKFLQSNHLVIDQNGMIIDGHHRWLSAYLINSEMELPAFRIRSSLRVLMKIMLDFSDERHNRNK